ncbi:MAG: HEAT repeat domain-containing protein [Planctomycetes bacterium]|nr:HEAT repeat domain-containing protein [Planctomycetota bacterium]
MPLSVQLRTSLPFVFALAVWPAQVCAQGDTAALIAQLKKERDDADVAIVQKIARAGTREAAIGLAEAYDAVATLLFRREICKELQRFANVQEAQQPALDKLAQIAGSAEDEVLRETSLHGLGLSSTIGKQLLRQIVASKASDELREPAMREHVKLAGPGDADWYRELWNLEQKQRKDDKGDIAPPELDTIRELAFEGLLKQLSEAELIDAIKNERRDPKIRRRALDWMDRQKMPKTADTAEWVLGRVDFPGADRAEAARIVFEHDGPKAVGKFLDLAKKRDDQTPGDLRVALAALVAQCGDDGVQKKVKKLVGKGKPFEKVFALQATCDIKDDKLVAAIRKELGDKDPAVRAAAAAALGARRDRDSLPPLRAMLASPQDPCDARAALEAIDQIEGPMSAWLKELAGMCASENRDVRNAAIGVLGKARDKRQLDALLQALEHDDWSTRAAAVAALLPLRDKKTVGPLVARIQKETGRMKKLVADALWQLTAQPFDEDQARWRSWWETAAAEFEVASEKELDEAKKARERRLLTQRTVTPAKFFGIRVESHRVIFVLDVSGSMLEAMYGRTFNDRPAARIDVAKQELTQAIEHLDAGALFNVFVFSSGVARWLEGGIGAATAPDRKSALTWVERLGASGGTNLYDALRAAFADPDVDTIFLLSDGMPTAGDVIDPFGIRQAVADWNRHRKVVVNSIAIGGSLEVLEWLAKDSGGSYRQLR